VAESEARSMVLVSQTVARELISQCRSLTKQPTLLASELSYTCFVCLLHSNVGIQIVIMCCPRFTKSHFILTVQKRKKEKKKEEDKNNN